MKKFSQETNGYNREEVKDFIREVIQETEVMTEKYKEQEEQIQELKSELKHYKELEENLKDVMVQEESEKIIMTAKKEASEIINDALQKAEVVESQRKRLAKNLEIFKKKLKLIIEQQRTIIEKIDELEIEE